MPTEASASEDEEEPPKEVTTEATEKARKASEIRGMRRELDMLARADVAVLLERLNEVWDDRRDPNERKEFDDEKKRVMLSALYNMDKRRKTGLPTLPPHKEGGEPRKVLAIHESHREHPHRRWTWRCPRRVY